MGSARLSVFGINVQPADRFPAAVLDRQDDEPLDQLIAGQPDALEPALACKLVCSLAHAVLSVHKVGFLHLRLTPSGITVERTRGIAKLVDWGHTVPITRRRAELDLRVGSLGVPLDAVPYASEELLSGDAPEARDDVYAVACIAYELFTGTHPFGRRSAREAAALSLSVDPITTLNARQNATLAQALALHRTERRVSLAQLAMAFSASPGPGRLARLLITSAAHPGVRMASVALIIGGIALGFGFQWGRMNIDSAPIAQPAVVADPQAATDPPLLLSSADTVRLPAAIEARDKAVMPEPAVARVEAPPKRHVVKPPSAVPASQSARHPSAPPVRQVRPSNTPAPPHAEVKAARAMANPRPPERPSRPSRPSETAAVLTNRPVTVETPLQAAKKACPECDCYQLEFKRNFTLEPLSPQQAAYYRGACRR